MNAQTRHCLSVFWPPSLYMASSFHPFFEKKTGVNEAAALNFVSPTIGEFLVLVLPSWKRVSVHRDARSRRGIDQYCAAWWGGSQMFISFRSCFVRTGTNAGEQWYRYPLVLTWCCVLILRGLRGGGDRVGVLSLF